MGFLLLLLGFCDSVVRVLGFREKRRRRFEGVVIVEFGGGRRREVARKERDDG